MNSSFAEHLRWEHRLVVPYKGIQDSPGFWIPRRNFRIPKPRIPNSSIKMSNIPDSTSKKISWIPDLDSLAWREPWASGKSVYCFFPLKDRGRLLESITKNHQHFKMDKEGRTVYLYVDLYLSGCNDLLILETEDSTIQPALLGLTCTPELTANASKSVLWRKISDYS